MSQRPAVQAEIAHQIREFHEFLERQKNQRDKTREIMWAEHRAHTPARLRSIQNAQKASHVQEVQPQELPKGNACLEQEQHPRTDAGRD